MTNVKKRAAKKPALDFHAYPAGYEYRTGCKVCWHIYKDRGDAEACAIAAKHNARICESLGYDFGYCTPGSIDVLDDGRFEVCCP